MITTTGQPASSPQPVRFTVQDYHRLLELGFLNEDDHIELIRGELVRMAAKGTAHESCLRRLLRILPRIIGDRATLQYYWLLNLSDRTLEAYSEPAEITLGQFGYLSKRIIPTNGVVQLPQFPEQVLELASIFPNSSQ